MINGHTDGARMITSEKFGLIIIGGRERKIFKTNILFLKQFDITRNLKKSLKRCISGL